MKYFILYAYIDGLRKRKLVLEYLIFDNSVGDGENHMDIKKTKVWK